MEILKKRNAVWNDLQSRRELIQAALDKFTQPREGCPQRLTEAIRYSVLAPGKRLRPLLVLLACEACGGQPQTALPAACAVEFVHVYSLIHDDLPAMDNDELRRGQPTCHIQFDEATAILAGDSLQMLAIETMAAELSPSVAVDCCRILSHAAGRCALVGGQADDLAAEGRFGPVEPTAPLEFLQNIHRRKTSALITASVELGGVVGGGSEQQLAALRRYGAAIGLAFQIVDDCLDVEATPAQLGKNTRKDSSLGKLTYPGLLGLDESRHRAERLIGEACEAIAVFEQQGVRLQALARFVVDRGI